MHAVSCLFIRSGAGTSPGQLWWKLLLGPGAVRSGMGSFDSTLSLALPNDKVPLRMTGLERVPISQRADGAVEGKAHCAVSVVPTLAQRTRKNGAPPALVVQAGRASATRPMTKFRSGRQD